jgi:FAD binding domain-containing protein/berberine-like enzyme
VSRTANAPSAPPPPWLDDLREAVHGQVIAPADEEYDSARTVVYGGIDPRPAVIVRVRDAADVAACVNLAREGGITLSVRSGGHGAGGHAVVDGGLVIDVRSLKTLQVDPEGHTAWAESGVTAGEFTRFAAEHGLGVGFGDTGSVGLGGLTLGGGVGYLVRKHGLTIDSLLGGELVTADGQLQTVDESHRQDLYWAIRGGGGNFGVATGFRFRLVDVSSFVGGLLIQPATPAALAGFMAAAEAAPDELSAILNVMPCPPMPFVPPEHHGRLVLFSTLAWTGDVKAGERAIKPFRVLATPIADLVRPMSYPDIYPPDDDSYHPKAVFRTFFMDAFDLGTAERVVETLEAMAAPMRVAQLRVLGGAYARVANDATAYGHRDRRIMGNVAAFYETEEERIERDGWAAAFAFELSQGDPAGYENFLGVEGEARVRAAYPGATWDRLRGLKARWDPDNLFRSNQNIPPAP